MIVDVVFRIDAELTHRIKIFILSKIFVLMFIPLTEKLHSITFSFSFRMDALRSGINSLERALISAQNDIESLRTRHQFVRAHILQLEHRIRNPGAASAERLRQLNVELEDYEEELALTMPRLQRFIEERDSVQDDLRRMRRELEREERRAQAQAQEAASSLSSQLDKTSLNK